MFVFGVIIDYTVHNNLYQKQRFVICLFENMFSYHFRTTDFVFMQTVDIIYFKINIVFNDNKLTTLYFL